MVMNTINIIYGIFTTDLVISCNEDTILGAPVNVVFWLTYLANYSYGKTYTEIMTFLNLKSKDEIQCIFEALRKYVNEVPKDMKYYDSVNLVADNRYKFSNDFKSGLKDFTPYAKILNLNFNNPANATTAINNAIANDTNGNVLNSVKSGIITKSLQLNIFNGIYLKGSFEQPINFKNVFMSEYYSTSNCSVTVPFIYHSELYNYTESYELGAKVVEMPLKEKNFMIMLFLPNKTSGLIDMVQKLQDPDIVLRVRSRMKKSRVNMQLPLYNNLKKLVDSKYYLQKIAKLETMFNSKTAQFKNIIVNNKAISFSLAYQKIVVMNDVNNAYQNKPYDKDHSESLDKVDEYDFKANHPIVVYVMFKGITVICMVPKPVLLD